MAKKYQVFVSSTFLDLQEERQAVAQALLGIDCIPSGMELFPASSEGVWSLIRRVIDECDYYLVMVAGRYGSRGPRGTSFTQMEYKYAMASKPVLAFVHGDPSSLPMKWCEKSEDGQKRLARFRKELLKQSAGLWDSKGELKGLVIQGVTAEIARNPANGWIPGKPEPRDSSAGRKGKAPLLNDWLSNPRAGWGKENVAGFLRDVLHEGGTYRFENTDTLKENPAQRLIQLGLAIHSKSGTTTTQVTLTKAGMALAEFLAESGVP